MTMDALTFTYDDQQFFIDRHGNICAAADGTIMAVKPTMSLELLDELASYVTVRLRTISHVAAGLDLFAPDENPREILLWLQTKDVKSDLDLLLQFQNVRGGLAFKWMVYNEWLAKSELELEPAP